MKSYVRMRSLGLTLGGMLCATIAVGQAKPPIQNVQTAHAKVVSIKNHLSRVITGGGGGGGGGGGQGNHCSEYLNRHGCVANGCEWKGNVEVGYCRARGRGGFRGHHNHFRAENDLAAQLAATGLQIGMNDLAQSLNQLISNYYSPHYFYYWNQSCTRARNLLVANQGAKVAAAIPPIGNFKPQFFEMYDAELISTSQLLWCN